MAGMPKAMCFVVIMVLPDLRYHPAWFRPDPLPGDPSHLWRFVLGGIHAQGYATMLEAQVQARVLGKSLADIRTDRLGALQCPDENMVLTRVLSVVTAFKVMVLPAWGPGTSHTLIEILDKTGQKLVVH